MERKVQGPGQGNVKAGNRASTVQYSYYIHKRGQHSRYRQLQRFKKSVDTWRPKKSTETTKSDYVEGHAGGAACNLKKKPSNESRPRTHAWHDSTLPWRFTKV